MDGCNGPRIGAGLTARWSLTADLGKLFRNAVKALFGWRLRRYRSMFASFVCPMRQNSSSVLHCSLAFSVSDACFSIVKLLLEAWKDKLVRARMLVGALILGMITPASLATAQVVANPISQSPRPLREQIGFPDELYRSVIPLR